jgi:hypothetical protein
VHPDTGGFGGVGGGNWVSTGGLRLGFGLAGGRVVGDFFGVGEADALGVGAAPHSCARGSTWVPSVVTVESGGAPPVALGVCSRQPAIANNVRTATTPARTLTVPTSRLRPRGSHHGRSGRGS